MSTDTTTITVPHVPDSVVLRDGRQLVGSDLSVFIHSIGPLLQQWGPQIFQAVVNLLIHPSPTPGPTPTPGPGPTPTPAPTPQFDWLAVITQLLQIFAPPAPAPTPTPVPTPTPTPPSPPKALPPDKRPSKDDVVNELKAQGVDVGVIPIGLLSVIINLAMTFGLPYISTWIKKFFGK